MKTTLLILGILLISPMAMAEEQQQAEVAPHIFTDLNGNGISDLEEGQSPGANPNDKGIDQEELPPTPPEEETPPA